MALVRALGAVGLGVTGRTQRWATASVLQASSSFFSTEAAAAPATQERSTYDPAQLTPRERLLQQFNQRLYALTQPESRRKAYMARDVLDEMRMAGIKPNYVSYHTAIVAAMHSKRLQDVLYFLKEMTDSGRAPDTKTYNAVLSTCARAGQSETTKEILEDMRIRGVKWDQRTVSSILNACAASGDPAFAEKIRSDAAEAGIETNAFMLAATMRAHTAHRGMVSRDRKLQKVREIVEESRSLGPEVGKVPGPVFDSLVACLVLLHENKEALRVYASRELEGQQARPVLLEHAVTAQLRIDLPKRGPPGKDGRRPEPAPEVVRQRVENLKAAMELADEVKASGVQPNLATRNALVLTAARLQQRLPEDEDVGTLLDKSTRSILTTSEWFAGPEEGARWITILSDARSGQRGLEYALRVFDHLDERKIPVQLEAAQMLKDALEARAPEKVEAIARVTAAAATAKPRRKPRTEGE